MKRIVEFKMDDGSSVYVEVEEHEELHQRVSRVRDDGVEEASDHFTNALNRIRPAAEMVLNTFRELNTPEEIVLEFGLKFSGRFGVIFTAVDSAATFKIALKWSNKPKP